MKTLKGILYSFIAVVFSLALTGCNKNNMLDITVYCQDKVKYELNDKKRTEGDFSLTKLNNGASDLNNYTRIQITTKKDWVRLKKKYRDDILYLDMSLRLAKKKREKTAR